MDDFVDLSRMLVFKDYAYSCAESMDRLAQRVYLKDFSLYDALSEYFNPQIVSWVEQVILKKQIASDDKVLLGKLFTDLSRYLQELPVLVCTFGYNPSAKFYSKFYSQVCNYMSYQAILIDVVVDPMIVAGAIFSINGRFYNYSSSFEFKQMIVQG